MFGLLLAGATVNAQPPGAPTISISPAISASDFYSVGSNITLTASFSGATPVGYSWTRNGTPIASGATLSFSRAQVSDAGYYNVTAKLSETVSSTGLGVQIAVVGSTPAPGDRMWITPESFTLNPGDSYALGLTYHITLSTIQPRLIKWYKDGVLIPSATNQSLIITGTSGVEGNYYAELGSFRSNTSTINLNHSPPEFATLPQSTWSPLGGSANFGFSYAATNGTATAQWYHDGTLIPGATLPSYSISKVTAADYGNYTVVATNVSGSTTSPPATLYPRTPPVITQQPVSQTLAIGGTLVLSVTATGTPELLPLTYQWRKDSANIVGATGSTFTKANVQASDAGFYDVIVSGQRGYETSNQASISVGSAPPVSGVLTIVSQPTSATVTAGSNVRFSIGVVGQTPISFQWKKNGVAIAGATSDSLNLSGVQAADAGGYSVEATNVVSTATSAVAQLVVNPVPTDSQAPTITSQPQSVTANAGTNVTFSATVSGGGPLSLTWLKDGRPITGSTANSTLTLINVQASNEGSYTLAVSSPFGQATSAAAVLALTKPATAPSIAVQPADVTYAPEATGGLSVIATGSPTLAYQWRKNGTPISGATTSILSFTGLKESDDANYDVVVSNSAGSVTSRSAHLAVNIPLRITAVSLSTAPVLGKPVTINSSVQGSGSINYQWMKNGSPLPGSTASMLTLSSLSPSDEAGYQLRAWTGTAGATGYQNVLSNLLVLRIGGDAAASPVVTAQPTNQAVASGATTTFVVAVSGVPAPTCQWFKNGVAIAGANNTTLTLANVSTADVGNYHAVISNTSGSATSNQASLSLTASGNSSNMSSPMITAQPVTVIVGLGKSFTLAVTASGSAPLAYAWFREGQPLSGATASSYSVTSAASSDEGRYWCTVSNNAGAVTSTVASVQIAHAPLISLQPHGRTVESNASLEFSVAATGTPAPTFQWRKQGTIIPGATSGALTLVGVTVSDAGDYDCVVSNSEGSVTSAVAALTVHAGLDISNSTLTGSLIAGGTALFSVTATGTAPLSYQWYRGDTLLPGATTPTLTLSALSATAEGDYKVIVSGPGGTRSAGFKLTLGQTTSPPLITRQPLDAIVDLGMAVTFSAEAIGSPTPSWQWRFNGSPIPGATASSYTLTSAQLANSGAYTVVATNAAGSTSSAAARLTLRISAAAAEAAGIYFGKIGPDGSLGDFALQVRRDGSGVLLINLTGSKYAILVSDFQLNEDRSFSVSGQVFSATNASTGRAAAEGSETRLITGVISTGGSITGNVVGLDLPLAGSKSSGVSTAAGYYEGQGINGSTGTVYTIVSAAGQALVVAKNGQTVDGGVGVVTSTSSDSATLAITTSSGNSITTTVNASSGLLTAAVDKGSLAGASFSGVRDDVDLTNRLANISARGRAGAGAEVMIAGFVIAGTDPRPVLIRAVGPTLANFGLTGALVDPRLELYRAASKISENDNWDADPSANAIAAAGSRVGAFALPASGKDAALLVTLDPAAYTAQVSSPAGTSGVALVEVYDAGESGAATTAPRLINISTRANVSVGEDVLIAGIVVTGNAPKRVLVRAIGPTLAGFGLAGALADPVLKILSGSTTIGSNDDWGTPSAGLLATDISSAAASVGAFALPQGSKDASLIITLQPGNYTAQVSGKNDSSGIALIEVYEIP